MYALLGKLGMDHTICTSSLCPQANKFQNKFQNVVFQSRSKITIIAHVIRIQDLRTKLAILKQEATFLHDYNKKQKL